MDATALAAAVAALRGAKSVVVLTGAGVSAESGVPTFRASDGLWEGHPIEKVATPTGFADDPKLVWAFYNARRANLAAVAPNPGHFALAAMERHWGENFTLVTQNVDGLHQSAGSRRVLEIHGNVRETRCTECAAIVDQKLAPLAALPLCGACGGALRPNIVWFHESLPEAVWTSAVRAVAVCDVLLVVGTSAVVHPAAGLVPRARRTGARVVEVNLTPTAASEFTDLGLYGPAGVVLPDLCGRLGIMGVSPPTG